jgi:hypothetical protein
MPKEDAIGFGILDAKGELFSGSLLLIKRQLEVLSKVDSEAARALRRRIDIIDFSSRDPLSPYNILATWPGADLEFFALSRADLILDLLGGNDKLSLSAVGVLQKMFQLLAEFGLPVTAVPDLIRDDSLRNRLLSESKNREVSKYFAHQFISVPKATLSAIERRLAALTASQSVRLALNGTTAPDFRRLQDEGRIVLINCFGQNIARSVRRLLQALVLSDIRQSVFTRKNTGRPFLWLCDEAQNFFLTERLRDNMNDLLTMSRSFGSFFLYLTQNMSTAVGDARILKVLHTNIRWAFCMRGDPADCEFLAPALPVTGTRLKPQVSPFDERTFHTPREERQLLLEEIGSLPDRTGYLWLKPKSNGAIKLRTADLVMPHGEELEQSILSIRRDATVGQRLSRKAYEKQVAVRDGRFEEKPGGAAEGLTKAYRQKRGGQ